MLGHLNGTGDVYGGRKPPRHDVTGTLKSGAAQVRKRAVKASKKLKKKRGSDGVHGR